MAHTRDMHIGDRIRFINPFPPELAGQEATVIERPERFQGGNMAAVAVRLDDGRVKFISGEPFELVVDDVTVADDGRL